LNLWRECDFVPGSYAATSAEGTEGSVEGEVVDIGGHACRERCRGDLGAVPEGGGTRCRRRRVVFGPRGGGRGERASRARRGGVRGGNENERGGIPRPRGEHENGASRRGTKQSPAGFFRVRWGGTGSRRGQKKQEHPSARAAPTVPIDPTRSGTPQNDQNRTTKGKEKSGGGSGKQVSRVCPPNGRHGRLVKGAGAVDGGNSRQLRSMAATVDSCG
jgi:hypothetical protein